MSIHIEAISRHSSKFFDFVVWRKVSSPAGPHDWTDVAKLVSDRYFAPKNTGLALEILQLHNIVAVESFDKTNGTGIKVYNTNDI